MVSPSFRTLLSQYAKAGYQFFMLELVRDELINKYKEMLYEQKRKLDDGIKEIRLKTGKELAAPLTDDGIIQMTDEYADHIQTQMKQFNVTMLGYPTVPHQKVVQRALQRKKPFDAEGHKGYRDALIWESILELITSDPVSVAFICQNPRDFADKNILHPVLQEEVSHLTVEHGDVIYYHDLESFVSKEIEPLLEVIDNIVSEDGYQGFDLLTFTQGELLELISYETLNPNDVDLPRSFEELQIWSIEDVDEISNVVIHPLSGNDLLVSYEAKLSASFTFLISNDEYLYIDDDLLESIETWDSDWNDYVRMCNIQLDKVALKIKLVFNRESATVKSAELIKISAEKRN